MPSGEIPQRAAGALATAAKHAAQHAVDEKVRIHQCSAVHSFSCPLQRGSHARHWRRLVGLWREVLARIDEPIGLELVLLVVELAVASVRRQQLRMGAALDDLARLEDRKSVV